MLSPYSVKCFTQRTGLQQLQLSSLERPTFCCQGSVRSIGLLFSGLRPERWTTDTIRSILTQIKTLIVFEDFKLLQRFWLAISPASSGVDCRSYPPSPPSAVALWREYPGG
jgi:hypothetical protein